MARRRTVAQWNALSPTYRTRLERKGVTRQSYLSGTNLSSARGQSAEKRHVRQRKTLQQYGPTDLFGKPRITTKQLAAMRKKRGDDWIDRRLSQLKRDAQRFARGQNPYGGDVGYDDRPQDWQDYSDLANEDLNVDAPWYWYHGDFGT